MRRFMLAALAACALAAPALAEIKVGDAAPDFTLKDQDGQDVKLSSFKGAKHVIVAFYPKDFSTGCTTEMKCLVKENRKVLARDSIVLAISVDTVESHKGFATSLGVQFKLLSDPDVAVARLYDVAAASASGSQAMRSAFIVDKEGKIRWLDRSMKVPVGTLDGSDLLAALEKIAAKTDPVAALAELAPADRDGRTVFVRFAQAILNEDITAIDAMVDPEACGRPGETAPMQRDRRKALMDRCRALCDKSDLRTLKFDEVIDVRGSRGFAKADATPAALTNFGPEARDMALRLADGEILVIGRTTAPKVGEVQIFPRQVVMRLRKTGDVWKIMDLVS